MKSRLFRIVAVYVPNNQTEHISFFRPLGTFLVDPLRIILIAVASVKL